MRKSMWKRTTAALTAAMLGAFAMPVMAAEEREYRGNKRGHRCSGKCS